jgi:hypothetical protein
VLVQEKLLDGIVGTSEDETFIKSMRLALAEGEMEDNKIDVTVSSRSTGSDKASAISVDSTVSGFEIFKLSKDGKGGKKGEKKKMTVAEARPIIEESEIERLMDEHDIPKEAIAAVEVRIENEEERERRKRRVGVGERGRRIRTRERRRREREGESTERHLYTTHLTQSIKVLVPFPRSCMLVLYCSCILLLTALLLFNNVM